jgi:HPr kinase/phosphorylase
MSMHRAHGTAIAFGRHGVLMRGAPGSGKSRLALQLIDHPGYGTGKTILRARLLADDQVDLTHKGKEIIMTPPTSLAGKMEIRGLGIVTLAHARKAALRLVVDMVSGDTLERMPTDRDKETEILGIRFPRLALATTDLAASARLRATLSLLVASRFLEA